MKFKCKNCWQYYISYYKNSKFCSRECKNSFTDIWNEGLSLATKKKILKEKYKCCQDCGYSKRPEILEVHHIIPTYMGEQNNFFSNLVCICPNCHALRHIKLREDEKNKGKDKGKDNV